MKRSEKMGRSRNADGTFKKEDYSKYIGKKYGRLKILDVYKNGTYIECKCICDCGNKKDIALNNLIRGYTKSCGCIKKNDIYNNLIGKRIGKLVIIEELKKSKTGQVKYRCKCDCGNYIDVYGSNLIYNQTKSCGCIHKVCTYNDTIPITNKSGVKGVYWSKSRNRWIAKLTIKGDVYTKGFKDFEEAVQYRKYLEDKYHKPLKEEYRKFKEKTSKS